MSFPSPAPLAGPPSARRHRALWAAAVFAVTATTMATTLATTTATTATTAAAEPPPFWRTNLSHKAWTKQDGAPSDAMAMVQDRAGMLWFGASDGLFRFDGVRFERLDDFAGNKLLSPNVRSLALSGDALWVGYAHGGISVFEHGAARHYGEAEGVPPSAILQIAQSGDGTRWFSSPAGIYRLDGMRWRRVSPADGVPPGDQPTFNVLPDGGLLVTHLDGLYRQIPGTHRFRQVDGFGSMQPSQLLPDGRVRVFRFGVQPRIFDPVSETSAPLVLPDVGVMPYSVHQDRRNAWWIGPGDGMRVYTPDFALKKRLPAPNGFSARRVFTGPFDDRQGNLWFMTENGVDRIRETRLSVQDMPAGSTDFSITAGADGEVWINSHSSLNALSPPTFAIAADGRRIASTMESATAGVLAADGTLWFGNVHALWSRRNGVVRRWALPPALIQQPVQALAIAADGRLWVSIMRRGVHTFKDGVWRAGGGHAGLTGRDATSLHTDPRGRLWLGYAGNAMAMLDQGKIRRFGAADGLGVGNVLAMFSRRGTLWVGGDQGLARFHNGRFVALDDSSGRPFAGVSGIVQTAAGDLWLHGLDGLVRIGAADLAAATASDGEGGKTGRVAAERFDHLDGHEGVPAQMLPLDSLVEAGDGRLWYATSGSVGVVDPRRIARNPVAPTPLITALTADTQRYRAARGLGLPRHTHNLRIDFTAAVLSIPERARFRTRLVGQDHAWRDAGALRQAFYTNLGPGDYRFEVMAANEDGLWSAAPASLAFSIAPAFYQTFWFKLACGALLAAGAYLLHRRRLDSLTARAVERMRAQLEERERIARTLHDTFLQSVQGLILRFHSIKNALPKDDAAHARIDAALDAADAVLDEGRDQLLDLRVHHACRDDLAPALATAGGAACDERGVAFSLHERGEQRALRADAQDELYAIAKEAIANALRHSGSATLAAELSYGAAAFTLAIRDQGKGFDVAPGAPPAAQDGRHWGLTGMAERAARIGGALRLESAPGAGATVEVSLPAALAYR